MVRGLLIALVGWSATAAADPVDVHVAVDVHVDDAAPALAPQASLGDPPHRYFSVTDAAGPNGMAGYRVQLDLAHGPGIQIHAGTLYTMFGAALASNRATALSIDTDDSLELRDHTALAYAAMGVRIGRLDARWYAGAGFEHTTGTQYGYIMHTAVDRYDPLGEIGGDIYLRIAGPFALVGGGRVIVHAAKYSSIGTDNASFWRDPGAAVFGGIAAITD